MTVYRTLARPALQTILVRASAPYRFRPKIELEQWLNKLSPWSSTWSSQILPPPGVAGQPLQVDVVLPVPVLPTVTQEGVQVTRDRLGDPPAKLF